MKFILLLGAGFSRNWGGWLADEAMEYLLGTAEVRRSPRLQKLLWDYRDKGGFEGALAQLQFLVSTSGDEPFGKELLAFNEAVRHMFADMNNGFFNDNEYLLNENVRAALERFDVIFTLNQDLLLERHYMAGGRTPVGRPPPKNWKGARLPGVAADNGFDPNSIARDNWQRARWLVAEDTPELGRAQPIIKLHGSAEWYRPGNPSGLMVLGGEKDAAIASDPLLTHYQTLFRMTLMHPGTRLMIIGYGFGDRHINKAILDGAESGLKTFVVDPYGAEVFLTKQPPLRGYMQRSLIGASRRPLVEALDPTKPEYAKVARFFTDD